MTRERAQEIARELLAYFDSGCWRDDKRAITDALLKAAEEENRACEAVARDIARTGRPKEKMPPHLWTLAAHKAASAIASRRSSTPEKEGGEG